MMYEFKMYSPCCKWYLEIQTDCSLVSELIEKLFGGFVIHQRPLQDDLNLLRVIIEKCGSGYIMTGKGKAYKIKDLSGVGFYLYAVIDKLVEENMDGRYCVLHGGVIVKNKNAYCVIAPTMAGKSTFLTYFVLNGCNYLADDYIFIDRNTHAIVPMPLPVSLRDTSALKNLLKTVYTVSGYNDLRGEKNTLISLYKNSESSYQLTKILFIRRDENNSLRLLNKGELYRSLLFNMKNALDLEKERVTVTDLIDTVEGYELSYKDLEFAYECLKFD